MRISDWSSDVCSSDLLDFRAGPYPSSIGRGERDSDRDARQVGDAEQLGIGRDGLAQGCAARDDLPRQGCRHSDTVERTTSATRCSDLLLSKALRDAGLGRGSASGDQILFGRNALVEQALLATQV